MGRWAGGWVGDRDRDFAVAAARVDVLQLQKTLRTHHMTADGKARKASAIGESQSMKKTEVTCQQKLRTL